MLSIAAGVSARLAEEAFYDLDAPVERVRDWLTGPESGWDKASGTRPPALPEAVVERTRARYVEAYERLTGERF